MHSTGKLQLDISHTLCDMNVAVVDISQNMFVEENNIHYKGSSYCYTARLCDLPNCNFPFKCMQCIFEFSYLACVNRVPAYKNIKEYCRFRFLPQITCYHLKYDDQWYH